MQFTHDQILKLAPDEASVKAGKALATASKWVVTAFNAQALWGDCQGSGKTPYKTIVDLGNLAFKCSCPSRKFPCKHGLGLLFLYVTNPSLFTTENTLAPHVEEWINKRAVKQEDKKVKEDVVVDEKAQQKRVEARTKKVDDGIEELRLWLKDLVRTGIMNVPQNAYGFNKNIAARMVDAQASGLANSVKKYNSINFYKDGWQKKLIKAMSKTYLLTEAYKNQATLSEDLRQEVRTLVGWNTAKEEVLNGPTVVDEWYVLAVTVEEDNNLKTERNWLYGKNTGRFALIINFYAAGQIRSGYLTGGSIAMGELAFYPSSIPLRALFKAEAQKKLATDFPQPAQQIADLYQQVTSTISVNPFAEQIPFLLSAIKIVVDNEQWFLVDADQKSVRLNNTEDECWTLLSKTRGTTCSCFVIYENEGLTIGSIFINGKYFSVK